MQTYWTRKNQVQVLTPGVDAPRLASSSTPEEWAMMGNTMFERKKYRQAKLCYQRALLSERATVANAYFLRDEAGKIPVQKATGKEKTPRNTAYVVAAEEFLKCVAIVPAQALVYYRTAAKCFEEGSSPRRAAKAYVLGEEYNRPTEIWDGLGMFDEAINLIQKHKVEIEADLVEQVVRHGKTHYYRQKEYS